MALEAVQAQAGHRSIESTRIYLKIANRVVADEYAAVSAKIDALYGQPPALPADYETTAMARLRREAHSRMLGNGLSTVFAVLLRASGTTSCRFMEVGHPGQAAQRSTASRHGYLLVVRSRLTVPLMDILDGIRAEGEQFAGWWELPDVEDRLRANPDLLERYSDVVQPS
jgi:hypothetical protein